MARTEGTYKFSSNFELRARSPLDAKQIVHSLSDLINPSTWFTEDGGEWTYVGMIVGVQEPSNGGVYMLRGVDYTNQQNWIKQADVSSMVYFVNSSLGPRDVSIAALYTWNGTQDASIVLLRQWDVAQDASLGRIDTSITSLDASMRAIFLRGGMNDASIKELYVWNDIQDLSLGYINVYIQGLDSSVTQLFSLNVGQEASISHLYTLDQNQDASINQLIQWNIVQDSSFVKKAGDIMPGNLTVQGVLSSDSSVVFNGIANASTGVVLFYNPVTHVVSFADASSITTAKDGSIGVLYAWNKAQDASIVKLDSSLSDTVSLQDLAVMNASLGSNFTWINGLLEVSIVTKDSSVEDLFNQKLNNTTDTFNGHLTINGSISLFGNLYQDGSTYIVSAEEIHTKDDYIILRDGAVTALGDSSLSGFTIIKPNGTNNVVFGTANDAVLRVGWQGDTLEAVATREDNPINNWFAYWDDSSTMFKTYDLVSHVDSSYLRKTGGTVNGNLSITSEASLGKLQVEASVYFKGVPNASTGSVLFYDPITKEVTYADSSIIQGRSYAFQKGLTEVNGTVSLGGEFSNSIDLIGNNSPILLYSSENVAIDSNYAYSRINKSNVENIAVKYLSEVMTQFTLSRVENNICRFGWGDPSSYFDQDFGLWHPRHGYNASSSGIHMYTTVNGIQTSVVMNGSTGLRYDSSISYEPRTLIDRYYADSTYAKVSGDITLQEGSTNKVVFYNPSTGKLLYSDSSILGGGGDPGVLLNSKGTVSGNITLDLSKDLRDKVSLTGTATFLLSNLSSTYSRTYVIDISANGADRTISWDSSLSTSNWVNGDVLLHIDANTLAYVVSINTNGPSKSDVLISWVKKGL